MSKILGVDSELNKSQKNCPLAGFQLVPTGKIGLGGQPEVGQMLFSCVKDQCKLWNKEENECNFVLRFTPGRFESKQAE